jgi:hypothetical protein
MESVTTEAQSVSAMEPLISESPRKLSRIASPKPESGDAKAVFYIFGLRGTHLRDLVQRGLVESVVIPGRGKSGRGKRLYLYRSIRKLLASQKATKEVSK